MGVLDQIQTGYQTVFPKTSEPSGLTNLLNGAGDALTSVFGATKPSLPATPVFQPTQTSKPATSGLSLPFGPATPHLPGQPVVSASTPTANTAPTASTNQILNVSAMQQYKPNQYTKDANGNVFLNAGVTPIAGTTKSVGTPFVTASTATPGVTVPSSVNGATAGNTQDVKPAASNTSTGDVGSFMSSISQNYASAVNSLSSTAGVTSAQNSVNDLTNKYLDTTNTLATKGTAEANMETQLGVTDNTNRLQQINEQIAQTTNSYNAGLVDIEGKPIPMQFITGQQAQLQRQKAVDVGALTSTAQAIQGNITLAQNTAKQTVDLQFAPYEQQLQQYSVQLDNARANLTGAQKKQADELSYVLQSQQQKLTEQKDTQNSIMNLMLQAAQNKAPQDVLDKIKSSTSVTDAALLASPYMAAKNGDWSVFTDSTTGDQKIIDKNTGVVRPVNSDTSKDYFTDANGVSWNMAGWAADPTKAAQMQSIATKIGKVDDSNIDAKVKQFTPGVTADMIRQASANSGVSWEALMTMISQESTGGTSHVATANNNFAGLTWTDGSQWQSIGGSKGTARPEGGNYISFPTKQAGLDAMGMLMAHYGTVTPGASQPSDAVAGWVSQINNGKTTIANVPEAMKSAVVAQLAKTPSAKDTQAQAMAKDKVTLIDNILNSPGLTGAVGPNPFARLNPIAAFNGDTSNFIANVQQLTNQETLSTLLNLKKAGGTLGALSDAEDKLLSEAATKINSWALKDKNGNVYAYKANESDFRNELNRIKNLAQSAVSNASDTSSPGVQTMSDGSQWQVNADGTYTKI